MLGYNDGGWAFSRNTLGEGTGLIWVDGLQCTGSEVDLLHCPSTHSWGDNYCTHRSDVTVSCKNSTFLDLVDIRLVGSNESDSGRVEIRHNGQWGTICSIGFDDREARVICGMLGYPNAGQAFKAPYFGEGSGLVWITGLNCTGNEQTINECHQNGWGNAEARDYYRCRHNYDASVYCGKTNVTTGK
ncbi:neurotrypsin-like [Ostrea edulis]|uniref:neurotrypsin-like n=1 Tax=Ostrea edulis TaxID=37623 RepID=UPI0024AF47D5|nr:neurotrypsin-like [Ostrea edulis]